MQRCSTPSEVLCGTCRLDALERRWVAVGPVLSLDITGCLRWEHFYLGDWIGFLVSQRMFLFENRDGEAGGLTCLVSATIAGSYHCWCWVRRLIWCWKHGLLPGPVHTRHCWSRFYWRFPMANPVRSRSFVGSFYPCRIRGLRNCWASYNARKNLTVVQFFVVVQSSMSMHMLK